MQLSSLLKSSPPSRTIVFLPDHLFFIRSIPVDTSAGPIAVQIELALEGLSPFAVAQLYYGYFLPPGAKSALVFAAYRKRFTQEQTDAWANADCVILAFTALLAAAPGKSTAVILSTETSMTGLAWHDADPLPVVVPRFLPADVDDAAKAGVRTALLQEVGAPAAIELGALPESHTENDEQCFTAGPLTSHLNLEQLDALDVRDKGELSTRRNERFRSLLLWRIFMGCAAALVLFLVTELALVGAGFWQKTRLSLLQKQRPVVQKIETSQQLANRIQELSAKRLMPFEMLSLVNEGVKRPESIMFTRTTTDGLYKMVIEAKTSNSAEISGYQTALRDSPFCEHVDIENRGSSNGITAFRLIVTFKPDALQKAAQSS